MNKIEARKELLDAIDILIQGELKKLSFSYHIEAKVKSVDTVNKKAIVDINGQEETLPYRDGLTLSVNNVVLVLVVNGNYSRKIIDMRSFY